MKKINKKQRLYIIIIIIVIVLAIVTCLSLFFLSKSVRQNNNYTKEPINEKFTFLLDNPSSSIYNDDISLEQNNYLSEIREKYKNGNYTINNPLVVIDPFGLSPQTALILFKTEKKEKVTTTLQGKHNDDLTVSFESSTDHYLPIYGLYGNYKNRVIITTESGKSHEVEIDIEDECDTGSVEVQINKIENSNGEFYFGTSSLGQASIAYDNYGEIRWWLNIGFTKGMTMLQNGHLLISNNDPGPDVTSTSGVVEVDMFGFIYHEYEIEGGYHHDAYELENGNLIILTTNIESNTFANQVIELDRNTGEVVKSWDLEEIVSAIDKNVIQYGQFNWGWCNSITYDAKTSSLIISMRNQNSVISIDYNTGKINWILGEKKYWSNKFDEYLIIGVGNDFIYPAGQHSVNILENGNLSIFNNGYDSYNETPKKCRDLTKNASYATIYKININNKTATVEWKYGGTEYFSYALSSFTYTENKHKIFNSGWHFSKDTQFNSNECTQFSNDLYDAYIIEFDENDNILTKLHINESKFEVIKAPIYNLEYASVTPVKNTLIKNYEAGEAKYYSTIKLPEYETLSEDEALSFIQAEELFVSFAAYNNRLSFIGALPDNSEMSVSLLSLRGNAYRLKFKQANEEMKEFLNLSHLPKGRYYVFIELDGTKYNTTEFLELH